jgi:hypothetical protein
MEDLNQKMRELERKSRAAFDESVEAMDSATRSKLARARTMALEELRRRRIARPAAWVPVGAVAAALAVSLLWQPEEASAPSVPVVAFEDFEIVAGGEDFDLLTEDADFVAWAAAESDGVG